MDWNTIASALVAQVLVPALLAMIGTSVLDVLSCAGIPDRRQRVGDDVAILQWEFRDDAPALQVSVALLGAVKVGSAGQPRMAVTFLRSGTVVDVAFPGSTGALTGGPYAAVGPLVSERLDHPNRVSLPAEFDTFAYLFVAGS